LGDVMAHDRRNRDLARNVGKYLAKTAIVFAAQLAAGKLGDILQNTNSGGIGPVWPASGIALGALLLWGYSLWPGVAAGAFLLAFLSPLPLWAAAAYAAGTTLAALIPAFLLRHLADFHTSLSRLRDVIGLIVFGALGSAMVSASCGASILYAANVRGWSGFGQAWLIYLLGDSMGVLLVTPVMLTFPNLLRIRSSFRVAEFVVGLFLLAVLCFIIFGDLPLIPIRLHILAFAVLPFLVGAAIRFGVSGAAMATLVIATIATVETELGAGPFASNNQFINAVLLDFLFAGLSVSGLTLAAIINEREQSEREREKLVREQAAMEERLKLAAIVEHANDSIISTNLDGAILSWNRAAQRIYGLSEAEALGQPLTIIFPPEFTDGEKTILQTIKTGEQIEQFETTRMTKTGKKVDISLTISPVKDASGKVIGTSAIARDITEQKRAEEALKNSEEKFSAAFRESPMALTLTSEKDHRYIDVNETFLRMTGWRRDEVIGRTPFDISIWVDPAERTELVKRLVAGDSIRDLEVRYRRKDGTERVGLGAAVQIEIEQERCVLSVISDITERKRAEEALKESEIRFRLLADTAPALIWMSGTDKLCNYFNKPWLDFTGRSINEELGNGWTEGVHQEDLRRCLDTYTQSFERRESFKMEYRLRHSSGEYRWILDVGVPRFNEGGSFAGYIGICVDDNERKQAEQEHLISENRFRQFFETMPEYCYMVSRNGDIIDTNLAVCEALGYTKAELMGKPLSTLYAPECAPKMQTLFEKWKTEGTVRNEEMIVITKKGERRTVLLNAGCVRDSNGIILHSTSIQVDITERRRAEEALRGSEARLRLAIEVGKMYAYEWDVATDAIVRSPEYVHILGVGDPAEQLTRQQILDGVHQDDRASLINSVQQVSPANPTTRVRYRFLRTDGTIIWLESIGHAFFDEHGTLARMIGMVTDITEHKRAEAALAGISGKLIEAQDQERARIARELHDDINQRIAVLAVELENWERHTLEPKIGDHDGVRHIRERLLQLGKDVQGLSHRLHSSKLDYLGIAAAAKSFCKELSEKQKVVIDFSHEGVPRTLSSEVSLCLFRVLQEALQNAVKYSGVTHFRVELRGKSGEIQLTVSDGGVGFAQEEAVNRQCLGLISMRERLQLVKGEFFIDSSPGHGTRVRACIPLRNESASSEAAKKATESSVARGA